MSVLKWFFGEARFGVVAFFITAAGLTYGFSKLSVRETAITGSFVRAAGVTVATASFSDKTTTPATGFTYTVRTVDAGGNAILNEIQRR